MNHLVSNWMSKVRNSVINHYRFVKVSLIKILASKALLLVLFRD